MVSIFVVRAKERNGVAGSSTTVCLISPTQRFVSMTQPESGMIVQRAGDSERRRHESKVERERER